MIWREMSKDMAGTDKIWRAGAEKGYGGNSIQKIWRERKKILDFRQTDVMCFLWREILAY